MSPQLRRSFVALLSCSIFAGGAALSPAGALAGKRHQTQALTEASPVAGSEAGAPREPVSSPQPGAGESGAGETGSENAGSGEPAGGELAPHARGKHRGKCELSLEASAALVPAGASVTLSGKLACPESADVAGQTITISETQRIGGAPSTSELTPLTTGEDGSFEVTTAALSVRSRFVARSPLARHGARALVRVTPKVTLDGPAAAGAQLAARASRTTHTGRNRYTFTGTVDPATSGTRAALQYQYASTDGGWRTVAFARVGAGGRYSFVHAFRLPGEVSVRVVAHPQGELAAASEPLSYEVIGPTTKFAAMHQTGETQAG
jgi:hypothetical protein